MKIIESVLLLHRFLQSIDAIEFEEIVKGSGEVKSYRSGVCRSVSLIFSWAIGVLRLRPSIGVEARIGVLLIRGAHGRKVRCVFGGLAMRMAIVGKDFGRDARLTKVAVLY